MANSVVVTTFLTSIKAIITVFLVLSVGFVLVKFKQIDNAGIQVLSKLSKFVFLPFLLLKSLGSGLSLQTMTMTWTLPFIGLLCCAFNFIVAKLFFVFLAKPSPSFRRFFLFGQSIPNMVALPLVLVSAVCSQVEFEKPLYLRQDENITEVFNEAECVEQGNLYLFMYSILMILLIWSVGYDFVNVAESSHFAKQVEKDEGCEKQESIDSNNSPSLAKVFIIMQNEFKRQLSPINLSQYIGLCIGLIAPIRKAIFEDGFLSPLGDAISIFAEGSVSVINIILSATLAMKLLSLSNWKHVFGDLQAVGASRRTLLCYSIFRMILMPMLSLILLMGIQKYVFEFMSNDDKLFQLVVYLEVVMPSANVVVVIAQITKQQENAEILALGVLLQYMLGIVTLTGFTFMILYSLDLT